MRAQKAKYMSRKATHEWETRIKGTFLQGGKDEIAICQASAKMHLSSVERSEEDDTIFPKCGIVYADIGSL